MMPRQIPIDIEVKTAEREWRRSAMPGASECPECGAMLYPEDCEALCSCESCGWLGKLSKENSSTFLS